MGYVVGSAEVELVPTAKGFDEKTNLLLGDLHVKVHLDADTLGVREELASIRDAHVNVKADADTALAEAQIDEVARPREATIGVSAPGAASAGSTLGGILTTVLALGPALIPLTGGLTAMTLGLSAMAGAAGLGVGALAAITLGALAVDKSFKTALTPALDGLKKSFDHFVSANSTAILGPLEQGMRILAGILPSLTPIVRAAGTAVEGLLKPLKVLVDNGTFSRWAAQIATLVGPAVTGFGKILGNLTLGLGQMLQAFAPFGKVVLAGLVSMTGQFAKIGQSPDFRSFVQWSIQQVPLVSDVLHSLLGVAGGLLKVLAPWGQFVLSFIDALLGGSKGMASFNASLTNLQNSMPQFVSLVSTALTHVVDVIVKAAPSILTGLVSILGGLVDAIAKSLPKLLPALTSGLNKLVAALISAVPELLPPIIRLVGTLLSGLLSSSALSLLPIPALVKSVSGAIAKNAPLIAQAFVGLGPIFASAFSSMVTQGLAAWPGQLGRQIGMGIHQIPALIDTQLKAAGTWLVQLGQNLLTGLVQGIVIGVALVRDLLFTWPVQFGKWLARMIPTFLDAGWKALVSLEKGLLNGWINVQAWFAALPARIGAFFADAPTWLIVNGIRLLDGLRNGIVNGYIGVTSWFRSLPSRIEAFGAGAISWLASVGHNIVQGLLNGLSGAWGAVTSFVQNAINAIPSSIRKLLGINSPSTVMAEIGGFMGQGLKLGLTSSMGDALDAATDLITHRASDLAVKASIAASVSHTGDASAAGVATQNGLLQQMRDHLASIDAAKLRTSDIASAVRVQSRTGGVVAT